MSFDSTLTRIAALQSVLGPATASQPSTAPTPSSAPASFRELLQQASAPAASAVATPSSQPATSASGSIVAAAQAEVGQAEQPPGSNDSPRIAQYRTAVPGGGVGPWCAYFASWAAAQAGTPLGDNGKGFARVDDVWAWGQRTGRAVPAGPNVMPRPGDLVIWDEHMGIVESVRPDGSIQTIEGNSSDKVSRRTYGPGAGNAIGYVRLTPGR